MVPDANRGAAQGSLAVKTCLTSILTDYFVIYEFSFTEKHILQAEGRLGTAAPLDILVQVAVLADSNFGDEKDTDGGHIAVDGMEI